MITIYCKSVWICFEEEWFGITHFNTTEYAIEFLKQDFNSAEHHQIRNNEYDKIKYFCAYQDDDYFCFQRFTYSNIINKRWFSLNGEPEIKKDEPIIILKKIQMQSIKNRQILCILER
ncbi:hypothetical protein RCZ01_01790 [Capnocytophaga felis]|uniref:Uncharacterized protein n=1 Tax=Capnocytophaga felis TaxID=2267611 RepID=A0A5M4B6H8_9FLAO|nr:hypothetical protein RCZ01_01790 [Capnocytophaga felis]GET49329.1 hypothetical protein RCZ02_21600 [Capnocytophaga felis]